MHWGQQGWWVKKTDQELGKGRPPPSEDFAGEGSGDQSPASLWRPPWKQTLQLSEGDVFPLTVVLEGSVRADSAHRPFPIHSVSSWAYAWPLMRRGVLSLGEGASVRGRWSVLITRPSGSRFNGSVDWKIYPDWREFNRIWVKKKTRLKCQHRSQERKAGSGAFSLHGWWVLLPGSVCLCRLEQFPLPAPSSPHQPASGNLIQMPHAKPTDRFKGFQGWRGPSRWLSDESQGLTGKAAACRPGPAPAFGVVSWCAGTPGAHRVWLLSSSNSRTE